MKTWILVGCLATLGLVAAKPNPKAFEVTTIADDDFKKFWQRLRTAVIGKNRFEVMKMVHFPVENLICSDIIPESEHDLPRSSKEKFKSCYYEVFSRCMIQQFKKNRFPTKVVKNEDGTYKFDANMRFREYGKLKGEGTVTLIFKKVNGAYKIIRILCVGGCSGDC